MKKLYFLALLICLGLALSGIVNAGTGTFYDASNFGSSGGGGGGGGTGNVTGPAGATDNAVCRYDGGTGLLIQNSLVSIDDTGSVVIPAAQSISLGATGSNLTIVGSTSGDATRPSILLDDTGPSITLRADSYVWNSGNNATNYANLTAASFATVSPVVATFPGAGTNSTRIGSGSTATGTSAISIGVNPTSAFTDGIAIGTTSSAGGARGISIGQGNTSNQDAIAIGTTPVVVGVGGICIGKSCRASGNNAIGIGQLSNADASDAVCVGSPCNALSSGSTSLGPAASVNAASSGGIAIGISSSADGASTVSIGDSSRGTGPSAIALGHSANTNLTTNAIAIGNNAVVTGGHTSSVCIGVDCATSAASQAQIGATGTPLDLYTYGKMAFGISTFGGGAGSVIAIKNATTNPTTNPTGGGILYVTGGSLHFRSSAGIDTLIAP